MSSTYDFFSAAVMLNLRDKILQQKTAGDRDSKSPTSSRASVRDRLLMQEVPELNSTLPPTCSVSFDNPSNLGSFRLSVRPAEGLYQGGLFVFRIEVPFDYNILPPSVTCLTRLWHPNISEDGNVCLSLLRPASIDGMGWAPTRRLKDVVWGINSLFTDLLDFDDPLNLEAAEHFRRNVEDFKSKVRDYIRRYCCDK